MGSPSRSVDFYSSWCGLSHPGRRSLQQAKSGGPPGAGTRARIPGRSMPRRSVPVCPGQPQSAWYSVCGAIWRRRSIAPSCERPPLRTGHRGSRGFSFHTAPWSTPSRSMEYRCTPVALGLVGRGLCTVDGTTSHRCRSLLSCCPRFCGSRRRPRVQGSLLCLRPGEAAGRSVPGYRAPPLKTRRLPGWCRRTCGSGCGDARLVAAVGGLRVPPGLDRRCPPVLTGGGRRRNPWHVIEAPIGLTLWSGQLPSQLHVILAQILS